MIVTIHQPSYWPYLGVFDKIAKADAFIFLDDVQFEKNEFKNRNRIFKNSPKASNPQEIGWLTLPVNYTFPQRINQVTLSEPSKNFLRNFRQLEGAYSSLRGFQILRDDLLNLYERSHKHICLLSDFCKLTMLAAMDLLAITPGRVLTSSQFLPNKSEDPNQRLIDLCVAAGATHYLAGSGSVGYLKVQDFKKAGIDVIWHTWSSLDHPYTQRHYLGNGFFPSLSVLDFLFNLGEDSPEKFRTFR